jgi:hypothetical protein
VALVEDPELADTALPELRRDTRPIIVDEPSERPRRRLRHWKTKDWKRRNLRRRQRNQQERFVAS